MRQPSHRYNGALAAARWCVPCAQLAHCCMAALPGSKGCVDGHVGSLSHAHPPRLGRAAHSFRFSISSTAASPRQPPPGGGGGLMTPPPRGSSNIRALKLLTRQGRCETAAPRRVGIECSAGAGVAGAAWQRGVLDGKCNHGGAPLAARARRSRVRRPKSAAGCPVQFHCLPPNGAPPPRRIPAPSNCRGKAAAQRHHRAACGASADQRARRRRCRERGCRFPHQPWHRRCAGARAASRACRLDTPPAAPGPWSRGACSAARPARAPVVGRNGAGAAKQQGYAKLTNWPPLDIAGPPPPPTTRSALTTRAAPPRSTGGHTPCGHQLLGRCRACTGSRGVGWNRRSWRASPPLLGQRARRACRFESAAGRPARPPAACSKTQGSAVAKRRQPCAVSSSKAQKVGAGAAPAAGVLNSTSPRCTPPLLGARVPAIVDPKRRRAPASGGNTTPHEGSAAAQWAAGQEPRAPDSTSQRLSGGSAARFQNHHAWRRRLRAAGVHLWRTG